MDSIERDKTTDHQKTVDDSFTLSSVLVLALVGFMASALMAMFTLLMVPTNRPSSGIDSEDGLIPEVAAIGSAAPDFEAVTLTGEMMRLGDLKGKVIALNFWATWCGPCLVEMPALQAAQEKYDNQEFVILAVNSGEFKESVDAYMEAQHLSLTTLLDPSLSVINLYAIRAFPTTIWITADGIVEAKHLGPLDLDLMDQYIANLLDQS